MTAPVRVCNPILVDVALGERSYVIVIGRGQLASLGKRMAKLRPGAKAVVISDETVAKYHLAGTKAALADAGIDTRCFTVPAGESSKSFSVLERVCEALLASHVERGDLLVALGGGVIGDLAGFAGLLQAVGESQHLR